MGIRCLVIIVYLFFMITFLLIEILPDRTNSNNTFSLLSFVTPDRKYYKIQTQWENDIRTPYVDTSSLILFSKILNVFKILLVAAQPKDPFDEEQKDALSIVIGSTSREYHYLFTWDGDKLIDGKFSISIN